VTRLRPVDVDWLTPAGSIPHLDLPVATCPAGVLWDAVRTPWSLAEPLWAYLSSNSYELRRLGPVVRDRYAEQVHWLVTPGCDVKYPAPCQLIGRGGWLSLPTVVDPAARLQWLHLPQACRVAEPRWLANHLKHQHTLTRPTLTTETRT
jgi:hypothetical protein